MGYDMYVRIVDEPRMADHDENGLRPEPDYPQPAEDQSAEDLELARKQWGEWYDASHGPTRYLQSSADWSSAGCG